MIKNDSDNVISVFFSKPFLGILLVLTIVSLLNIPILITLWRHSFDDGTYSHAYLIPVISLYLFYILQKLGKLKFREVLSIPATLIFISSCIALFLTSKAQISLGYWCSLLAVIVSSINMLYQLNRYIAFPSIFLVFIMPIWGLFTNILQDISVSVVTYFMSFTGVPTFVEDNFVTIPAGVFEIADGCSGLRYMIVSLAISSLFSFLYINNIRKTIAFFTLAVFGALLTNWLRITALILIGEYTNMESSLMEDHNTFGWYLFIPFMFILFWWGNKVADIDLTTQKIDQQPQTISKANETKAGNITNKPALAILLILLGVSSTTFSTLLVPAHPTDNLINENDLTLKPKIHFYSFLTNNLSSENSKVNITYHFSGTELDGKPSYYDNDLIPLGWKVIDQKNRQNVNIYRIMKGLESGIIVSSYEINNQLFSSLKAFKIARLKMALKNVGETKLHWKFIPCSQPKCFDELKNL